MGGTHRIGGLLQPSLLPAGNSGWGKAKNRRRGNETIEGEGCRKRNVLYELTAFDFDARAPTYREAVSFVSAKGDMR